MVESTEDLKIDSRINGLESTGYRDEETETRGEAVQGGVARRDEIRARARRRRTEATDSTSQKLLYFYRLLVYDKMIRPQPEDQVAEATMRHKLGIWYSKQLPEDHRLLK
jgi:hypothetical protein